ncbi:MAG: hypothetical protein PVI23_13490 [Maricaulaceae bacterium]|jgi:hypothetical protein
MIKLRTLRRLLAAGATLAAAGCGQDAEEQASQRSGSADDAAQTRSVAEPRGAPLPGEEDRPFAGLNAQHARILRAGLVQGHFEAALERVAAGDVESGVHHVDVILSELTPLDADERWARVIAEAVETYKDRLAEDPPAVVLEASTRRVEARILDAAAIGTPSEHARAVRTLLDEAARNYAAASDLGAALRARAYQSARGYLLAAEMMFEARSAEYAAIDPPAAQRVDAAFADVHDTIEAMLGEAAAPEASVRAAVTQLELAFDPFY